ncbi:hypothetical protein ASP00_25215 [Salmonella enterica subsp. enterica serovar Dublin]|nr:hypothetical protein [Salmonella enterica subsp. enterica serovar Dublin]
MTFTKAVAMSFKHLLMLIAAIIILFFLVVVAFTLIKLIPDFLNSVGLWSLILYYAFLAFAFYTLYIWCFTSLSASKK